MMTHLLAAVLASGLSGGNDAVSTAEQSVEDAARAYRIQVYQTFHSDRAEFDRRRAEWWRLEQSWIAAGKQDSDAPLLVKWLNEAAAQSSAEAKGPLPEFPTLAAAPKAKEGESAIWRMLPHPPADTKSESPAAATRAAATESQESRGVTPGSEQGKTTPVSSRHKLDEPALEKAPDETAPVSAPVISPGEPSSNPRTSSAAPRSAPAAVWFHRFEHWLGNEVDAVAQPPAESQESN